MGRSRRKCRCEQFSWAVNASVGIRSHLSPFTKPENAYVVLVRDHYQFITAVWLHLFILKIMTRVGLIQCCYLNWTLTPVQSLSGSLWKCWACPTSRPSSCSRCFPLCLRGSGYFCRLCLGILIWHIKCWNGGFPPAACMRSLPVVWHVILVVGVGFLHFVFVLFPLFPQEECFPLHQRKLCCQMTSVTMICGCYFLGLSSVC